MAQNTQVERPIPRYTRTDFTSLRAWLSGVDVQRIASLYFTEDELDAIGCVMPAMLQGRLEAMRDHLIERAVVANPKLAEGLRYARRSDKWSKLAMGYLFEAAEFSAGEPIPQDGLAAWFKPRIVRALESEGLRSLAGSPLAPPPPPSLEGRAFRSHEAPDCARRLRLYVHP